MKADIYKFSAWVEELVQKGLAEERAIRDLTLYQELLPVRPQDQAVPARN